MSDETGPDSADTTFGGSLSADVDPSWRMWAHLAGLANYLPFLPVFGGALAALVIWLTVGKRDPEVEAHARASLNFQITVLVALAVSFVLCLIVIGWVLIALVTLAHIALSIVAAVHASRGELWNNPFLLPWIPASR